jgi:integrase
VKLPYPWKQSRNCSSSRSSSLSTVEPPYSTCCHTFRATGITTYLKNGGTLEHAQQIAAHESPRTTKLYDRTSDQVSVNEIERIKI